MSSSVIDLKTLKSQSILNLLENGPTLNQEEYECRWENAILNRFGEKCQRWVSAGARVNNTVYMYGGIDQQSNSLQDMCVLNLDSLSVTDYVSTNTPGVKEGHTIVQWRNFLVLFGGLSRQNEIQKFQTDLWYYNLINNVWEQRASKGMVPKGRDCHAAWVVDDKMIIFGGSRNHIFSKRFYCVDLNNQQ